MQIRISVRNLVEFLLRSGDLDNRRSTMADREAMQLGSRIHRKIQKSMDASYQPEVSLAISIPYDEFELIVDGRADGIISGEEICIDEIKGVFLNVGRMEEPIPVHLAQAKVYAYIYGSQNHLETIGVQMTYVNLESEEIRRMRFSYALEELETWFRGLTDSYYPWAKFRYEWRNRRNRSAASLEFPFEYREGQKKVAAAVYRTIEREKKLFLMAPTGVGKTIATLFPAVKAVGEERAETIFYLTAKTITRSVAEKAYAVMRKHGLQIKVLTLTAKEKICFQEETDCNPDSCPYAKGHFDRVNGAVYDLLMNEDSCDREMVLTYAEKHRVCPFEMALDLSLWVDAVICDYNYLFDPNAHLRRFFADGVKGDYLFLIDEAHNLVERGREMYSASIRKEDFLEIRREVGKDRPSLTKKLSRCNDLLLEYKRECEDHEVLDSLGDLPIRLLGLISELEDYLENEEHSELRQKVLEFYFKIRMFLYIYELCDEHYVIYSQLKTEGFFIHLYCVDPSENLGEYLDKGVAAILFSATFLPIRYYQTLLSREKDDYTVYAESPFPKENRLVAVGSGVSTVYRLRSPEMYERYAEFILKGITGKKGNYMAFFPSYALLREIRKILEKKIAEGDLQVELLSQENNMREEEREAFLQRFEQHSIQQGSLMGLCVMGGIFAEGIDLTEDALIGAFIVGTGLPQVCLEREILKDYFDAWGENGFQYAYLYAGMNRVLQAAGRVIRTETDRGIVLLLDDRFQRGEYQELFPREWEQIRTVDAGNVEEKIKEFWKNT